MSTIAIKSTCMFCGRSNPTVDVEVSDFIRWYDGELIQRVWPNMSQQEREYIKTGICADCFPTEEDDE